MTDVYLAKHIDKIIDNIDYSKLGDNVAIKVHFGESGCVTYMNPEIVKKIYNKLISLGKKATLIETNVLYKGSRTNSTNHIKTANEHGFNFAPIDILDGELGDETIEVELSDAIATPVKLGKNLQKYDSMLVIAHFKGHGAAGYGGTFKTIGMGIGSRAGKLHMHADVNPSIDKSGCIGCELCDKGCDFNAIEFDSENKASIIDSKCTGCAMCIAQCPTGAVKIPWGNSTNENLQRKIIDYTRGVFKIIPENKCVFINIMEKITKDCDCYGTVQTPMMDDVGILMSTDPVSLDKACLDLADHHSNCKFNKLNPIDKTVQTEYASKHGLGELEYNIINIEE